jgi:hypothetical protein
MMMKKLLFTLLSRQATLQRVSKCFTPPLIPAETPFGRVMVNQSPATSSQPAGKSMSDFSQRNSTEKAGNIHCFSCHFTYKLLPFPLAVTHFFATQMYFLLGLHARHDCSISNFMATLTITFPVAG